MGKSLVVFGLLGPYYLTFALAGPGFVITVFPNPFAATVTSTVDPFGATAGYKSA